MHKISSSFTVWSPLWSELCAKFFSLGGCSLPRSDVLLPESANRVCFLLLSILSILSTFFPSFRLDLYCVCPSTVLPAFRTTTHCSCCVNFVICTVNFLYFRDRHSLSFLSSLLALAVSSPFGTLALNSCPLAGV
jgi:hypothetical protein